MRILVVDDEAPARDRLIRLLKKMDHVEVVGQAGNGLDALKEIDRLSPDLVVLDIEMPELNGLEVAESLGENRPAVVFATAYDKFALEAFDVAALDYLVKPISKERLKSAVDKVRRATNTVKSNPGSAMNALGHADGRLAVRTGSNFEIIAAKDVSAVIADEHYAVIICGSNDLLSEESLDALEKRLAPHGFLRCHRSAIVNLKYITRLNRIGDRKYVAVLSDNKKTELPISRDRLPELKASLNIV